MAAAKRYYLTTPIYYVNDAPHIGHAYTSLACDALARFKRLDGFEVKFLTGTDEHGQKVQKAAETAGVDPQAFTDRVSQHFRDLSPLMNYSNDDFIRTTEPRHIKACQELWRRMKANGHIYLGKFAGWYAVRDEAFYDESELVDGKAPTGAEVEWFEEENYFFDLSKWQQPLLDFYEANPSFLAPRTRKNEIVSFVSSGLRDLSISRTSFKWGVPVPDDPKHIMYVWIDALTNYMSAAGFPDEGGEYAKFWPADLHMVGKDIIRFHTVYWPAFLMAAGLKPPKRVFAHGWWTNEGQKMSKSLNNFITPKGLIDRYGLDPTRYFLLRELSFGQDGDFSHQAMVRRINTDLANDFGNLAQRVLSQIAKNCEAKVPVAGALTDADKGLLALAHGLLPRVRGEYDEQQFHKALEAQWEVVGAANRYVDEQAPWALKKFDPARMATVLYVLAETIRHLAILAQPVMPQSASRMLDLLAVPEDQRSFAALGPSGALKSGTALPAPQGVFPRHVEEGQDPKAKAGAKAGG
ncbi:MAG: methionine--tRNA ligase [Rhodospirillaceae bacterium]|nr:methionine--tRNA ligase [Rhodospirillaceae bacterium]